MNPLSLDLLQGRSSGGAVTVGSDTFCLITPLHLSALIDPAQVILNYRCFPGCPVFFLFFCLFFFSLNSCFKIETLKRGISPFSFLFGSHLEGKFPRCTLKQSSGFYRTSHTFCSPIKPTIQRQRVYGGKYQYDSL